MFNSENIKNNKKQGLSARLTEAPSKRAERHGFSIGEVMLSVFILGTVLTVIMNMYVTGLNELMDERDSIIASLLAQEGVELVRNIRDNNWVNGDESFLGDIEEDDDCRIDYNDANTSVACDVGSYVLSDNSFTYDHDSGTPTEFARRIIIADTGSEREILSLATWNNTSPPVDKDSCTVSSKCVFSESILTKWGEIQVP
jgi:Tfp pilus assembly protein PilV